MQTLFILLFTATITFVLAFLYFLPNDVKKLSLRPLFLIFFAIGLWIACLPALLAPPPIISISTQPYNIITYNVPLQCTSSNVICPTTNTVAVFPALTTNSIQIFQIRTYNSFFYLWLIILTFLFFLLLFWFLMLLRARAAQLLKGGRDMMEEFEKSFKRK